MLASAYRDVALGETMFPEDIEMILFNTAMAFQADPLQDRVKYLAPSVIGWQPVLIRALIQGENSFAAFKSSIPKDFWDVVIRNLKGGC